MKHKGCILEFTDKRNDELMAVFRAAIANSQFIDLSEISKVVVNSPCSRFWVSEERATVVMSSMIRGFPVLQSMRPVKQEMFREIFRRVQQLKIDNPGRPLYDYVLQVVNSPAPKFYMKPRSAIEILYKIKKGHYSKHIKLQ